MMEPILKVNHLKKVFHQRGKRDVFAVENISFSLQPGEILGIVGESGSGKVQLQNLITRLVDPTEGEIILDGQDITHLKGTALKDAYGKLQMVFQNPVGSFDPRRTLGDGIGESLRNKGMSKGGEKKESSRTAGTMRAGYFLCRPLSPSGQWRTVQRAAIARALAVDPKVMICDEATSALDVTVQKRIIELLRRLKEEKNLSYLFICHNLALVQEFCDRVLVMKDGGIVEEGTPDDVICNPQDEYTKMLVEAVL